MKSKKGLGGTQQFGLKIVIKIHGDGDRYKYHDREMKIIGMVCFLALQLLLSSPEQHFLQIVKFPMIWAMNNKTNATNPQPNAPLPGR